MIGTLGRRLVMNVYTAEGEYHKVQKLASALAVDHPKSDIEMWVLIHLAHLKFYSSTQEKVSDKAYKDLVKLYGEKVNKGLLAVLAPTAGPALGKSGAALSSVSTTEGYSLSSWPNPFNPSTVVSVQLPVASYVKLVVYDVLGREVATLEKGMMEEGRHNITWNATGVASGVYFVRFEAGDAPGVVKHVSTSKILLMK
jgi:hypothetical protein